MDKSIIILDDKKEDFIAIPIKEYKELLMIKGRYEELKSQYSIWTLPKGEQWEKNGDLTPPYKVTC